MTGRARQDIVLHQMDADLPILLRAQGWANATLPRGPLRYQFGYRTAAGAARALSPPQPEPRLQTRSPVLARTQLITYWVRVEERYGGYSVTESHLVTITGMAPTALCSWRGQGRP